MMACWISPAWSQTITTTAGSVTSCPGEIAVPVTVTNCNGVGAISLMLNFDNSKLTYLGYQNLNPSLNGVGMLVINSSGNTVVFSWINTTAANLGSSTLVQFRFTAIPGSSSLNWDTQNPGNCEYSDVLGNILPASYTNGSATINQPPQFNSHPVNRSILIGQNTTFSVSASGTNLAYRWQISTNGGVSFSDLSDNATYGGTTGSTLYLYNASLSMNGYRYRCKLTGTCPPVTYSDPALLTVTNPITTILPTASFCPGNIVVPVTVTNFTGVAAFSLNFSYNTGCLTYTGFQNANPALSAGLMAVNASGGEVFVTWSNNATATFGNGTIVELLFTAVSGTSPLTWMTMNEGQCEYSDLSGNLITSVWTNGNETIHFLPAVTVHPVDKTIPKTQGTTFGISATGTGLSYLWQVSTNGGASYTDLANNSTYSNVTTPTLTVSNAQLTMSGYKYRCRVTGTCTPVVNSNPATLTVLPNIFTTSGSGTICPGQLTIPVTVTDFIGVGSFSLTLAFNASVLTFTGHQNLHSALSAGSFVSNASNGKVYLTWSDINVATIPNGATLVELKFVGTPGTSPLTWDTQTPGNCEYADGNGLVVFSTWTNGSATVHTPPAVTTHPVDKTIYGGGSTSFTASGTATGIGYLWQVSTNGGVGFSNLTNVAPYSGVTTSTLTINPAAVAMNGYQYRCVVSGTCTPAVNTNPAVLTVTQTAINTSTGTLSNSCTGNLSVPVNVVNCNNVGSFSMTLVYDTTKLTYSGYHSAHAALSGGLMAVNRVANKVYFTWASTSAINIGAAVLIQYRFIANAGVSTTLAWDTQTAGACEYSDPNGAVITSFFSGSNLSVQANALIVDAGPDQVKSSASVQLNGTATGGTPPYNWLWSPSGSLNNPNIANPVATPLATTTYTVTVTATGCTGIDQMDVIVTGPPENREIQNVTVPGGSSVCYDATNTITVAGAGTTFLVENGGSAVMIAGQKIRYLPGTRVMPGGYMHGYITTGGQYCNTLPSPENSGTTATGVESQPGFMFKIYPNPTSGEVTIELKEPKNQMVTVTAFGSMGNLILTEKLDGLNAKKISLTNQPAGIYFLRITQGDQQEIRKVIRQ